MDITIYFPAVLGLFHNAATCSTTSTAIGCNTFWVVFYCVAMLVAYGAFICAIRYTYEQDAIKNNNNRKTKIQPTFTIPKLKQAVILDTTSFPDNIPNLELASRISKVLYQL